MINLEYFWFNALSDQVVPSGKWTKVKLASFLNTSDAPLVNNSLSVQGESYWDVYTSIHFKFPRECKGMTVDLGQRFVMTHGNSNLTLIRNVAPARLHKEDVSLPTMKLEATFATPDRMWLEVYHNAGQPLTLDFKGFEGSFFAGHKVA